MPGAIAFARLVLALLRGDVAAVASAGESADVDVLLAGGLAVVGGVGDAVVGGEGLVELMRAAEADPAVLADRGVPVWPAAGAAVVVPDVSGAAGLVVAAAGDDEARVRELMAGDRYVLLSGVAVVALALGRRLGPGAFEEGLRRLVGSRVGH